MKPSDLSRLIECSKDIKIIDEIIAKISKIQDIHTEVIQQIAINQYSLSTTQSEIVAEISKNKPKENKRGKAVKTATELSLKDIFHNDDDDDIFH